MEIKLFPLDESLSFWMYRTHTQGTNLLRRTFQTEGYDLTPEQCGVLVRLREFQGINQSQLGKKLFKDRHNMTRILNLLEKLGYIERRADETDKRIYRVFLTENGKAACDKLTPIIFDHLQYVFEGISEEDLKALQRTLEQMVNNIERRS